MKDTEEQYVEFWERYADEVVVKDIMDYSESAGNDDQKMLKFKCPSLWQRLTVGFDGNIRPCCKVMREDHYYKTDVSLGNATVDSLREIWHGEKINAIRRLHSSSRAQDFELCANCPYMLNTIV